MTIKVPALPLEAGDKDAGQGGGQPISRGGGGGHRDPPAAAASTSAADCIPKEGLVIPLFGGRHAVRPPLN